ncbi:MAG: tRNA 2-thiouridine(34) synthase MnmA, partial [Mycobacteriales bacterium]
PFYTWGMASEFSEGVIDDFVSEYAAGRTPNPCLRCNEKIKFAAVLDRAVALGFDAVATGHHVRLVDGVLRRSVDAGKDQSYVLAVLTRQQLSRAMFPLGDCTKQQVRAEAAVRGLLVADKPDSHDICFIPDGDTQGFLQRRLGASAGPIVDDATGVALGEHNGAFEYTVGQRKGLRLQRPAPDGEPRYVLSIEPVSNTVRVGPAQALDVDTVTARRPVWTSGTAITGSFECQAQLRAHGEVYDATAELVGPGDQTERLIVRLRQPARGVAAGQAVVLYRRDPAGDAVLASATITETSNTANSSTNPVGSACAADIRG